MEGDAYGSTKFRPNICGNDDKYTKGLQHISKLFQAKNTAPKIIVDDVLLYGHTPYNLLAYFRTVMGVQKHHNATLKLNKCKWFQDRCKFVGMEVAAGEKENQHKNRGICQARAT